ncbi:L-threonine 3-dehydrogenase [Peloplasma aerotolerans]|uniref:L-threonine 3-dehydrogenase n=1 Tax=Peloplasma aerotolerans TaxID=3044389 RepID=A0AAW6UEG4_9MOLU|nr:L-threonine 3-dehydrogenase [Mariniplasma sp. M4Ah]MDI6453388.1 L-threonine 3-dehydrogenase [Mariniplasma sp. M4Ah]MDR4968186.1 L-threonine 3-dehydrogenase [Acholeplasmataceae bacterium]
MDMTVVIKEKREPGFKITRKKIPNELKSNEVLIKVLATSICGTDVHIYKWDRWSQGRIKPPLTVGHEFCGEVIEVGSEVRKVKVGDVVSAETHIVCGECEFCRRGEYHICKNTQIIGVDTDGCFAEYAKMPADNLIINSKDIDPKYLSIQEPLGNAVHTMLHFDIIGKTVAVVGCGPIGLMGVNVAKAVGASKVIAIEVNDYRINLAKELGADVVINPLKENVIERVLEETNGMGVDVVGEFSGNKTAIEQAFKYVKAGGKMSMLGIVDSNIDIDLSNDIVFKGITIYGVVGRIMFDTWHQVTGLVQSGKLDLEKIVTHTFKLTDIEEGMKVMMSGNSGKVVLIP